MPTVYLCFSTDIIHGGHIAIIRRAQELGELTVGVLSDEAVAGYKRFPLLTCAERMQMFRQVAGVDRVIEQKSLSYRENLEALRKVDMVMTAGKLIKDPSFKRNEIVDRELDKFL